MSRNPKHINQNKVDVTNPNVAFGIVLRRLRVEKGLKQEDLEDDESIDRSYISKLELGKNQVCLVNFIKIANNLQITPEKLLSEVIKVMNN
ncbi:MAG: helix-turn-helix transcriptional regulator [Candidatus Kapaibacterium sp.]|nr:helix-turn-helix domain-containing protein [Bacteroidota bacterium]